MGAAPTQSKKKNSDSAAGGLGGQPVSGASAASGAIISASAAETDACATGKGWTHETIETGYACGGGAFAAAASMLTTAASPTTGFAGTGSKREIPAAAANAMRVAHCAERKEQGEANMAGESAGRDEQDFAADEIGVAEDCG